MTLTNSTGGSGHDQHTAVPHTPDSLAAAPGRAARRSRLRIASAESTRDRAFRRWATRAATGDVVAGALAAATARLVRFGLDEASAPTGLPYLAVGVVLAVLWPALLAFCGAYDHKVALFGVEEVRRVARAGVALLASVGVAHFLFALDLSRGYIGVFVPTVFALSALWRWALRVRTGIDHRRGVGRHRAVAIGPADELVRLAAQLGSSPGSAVEARGGRL